MKMKGKENLKKWKLHNITNGEMKTSPFFIYILLNVVSFNKFYKLLFKIKTKYLTK